MHSSKTVKSIPDGMHSVTPHLVCDGAAAAIEFYKKAFGAAEVSRKILRELERTFRVGSSECRVTASIGIARYPRDGEDAETLLKNADAAMYRAKLAGGNRFAWHGR